MNSIVEKPWGSFKILESGENFVVKKISINPGGILSLQSHNHRSEHWLVAKGEAEVTLNDEIKILRENDNIFIPKGAIHRITNNTAFELIIIEMWYGKTLDENDIKRYEDIYKRV